MRDLYEIVRDNEAASNVETDASAQSALPTITLEDTIVAESLAAHIAEELDTYTKDRSGEKFWGEFLKVEHPTVLGVLELGGRYAKIR